jgi:hypothetical protein
MNPSENYVLWSRKIYHLLNIARGLLDIHNLEKFIIMRARGAYCQYYKTELEHLQL